MSVKQTKDGRVLRSGADYTAFRIALWKYQFGECFECGRDTALDIPLAWADSFHCHHKHGRGMGGGKRNDILEKVKGLCGFCHRKIHNQK